MTDWQYGDILVRADPTGMVGKSGPEMVMVVGLTDVDSRLYRATVVLKPGPSWRFSVGDIYPAHVNLWVASCRSRR